MLRRQHHPAPETPDLDVLPKLMNWMPKLGWPAFGLSGWVGLGILGHSLLGSAWRNAQVAEFERSVRAVAYFVGAKSWQKPLESDPEWQSLEQQLDMDIVPLPEPLQSPARWSATPGGGWRASLTVPVEGQVGIRAIQGTRVYDDHGIDLAWWLTWSSLSAIVYGTAWYLKSRHQRQLNAERQDWLLWHRTPDNEAEIRHTREQLDQVTEVLKHVQEGLLAVDPRGNILLLNDVLIEQLGLNRNETYTGRRLLEAIRVPSLVDLVNHTLQSGQTGQQTIELGNEPRFLQLIVIPISNSGQSGGALLSAMDVSTSQRSELARREFITGASHELKTPLAAIRAYTETLQSMHQEDPEHAEKFLANILEQADRMDRLVSGMLQLARAEAGALKLKIHRLDATQSLKPCIEAASGMARTKGIQFVAKLPEERTLVLADRDALQTIASNLLSNAIRYTPSGGQVSIELIPPVATSPASTKDQSSGLNAIRLVVEDTGIGIPQTEQARVFERFYRVQKDRALDSGGTGLGLAIVKQLVQALSGQIELVSRPGHGTRFVISLPAVGFTQSSSNIGG